MKIKDHVPVMDFSSTVLIPSGGGGYLNCTVLYLCKAFCSAGSCTLRKEIKI